MWHCSSRITKETLHWVAPNNRKENVVDIYNTYCKTVIFYNFEVLFFEQNEYFKELGCFKFCSYCINKYYNIICSITLFYQFTFISQSWLFTVKRRFCIIPVTLTCYYTWHWVGKEQEHCKEENAWTVA